MPEDFDPFPDSSPYIDQYDIEPQIYGFFDEPNMLFTKKGRPFGVHHDRDQASDARKQKWYSRHRNIWPLVSQIFNIEQEAGNMNPFIKFNEPLQPQFEATGLPKEFFAALMNYVDKGELKSLTKMI